MTHEERRRFPRLSLDVGVDFVVLPQPGTGARQELFTTGSKNLSLGGICILVFEKLKVGDALELKFSIPGLDRFIVAKGRVVWSGKLRVRGVETDKAYEAGIEFVEINQPDKERIQAYVSSKLPPDSP